VLQETLLRVWQVAPRHRGDGRADGLLRFAVRVARNGAVSELRRARVATADIERLDLAADEPIGADPDPHLVQSIRTCRERLPRQPARALEARLRSEGAEPDRTLAERVGMKLNTFLQNVTRARRLLADCLRRLGVELDEEIS
jgi:RNA polymerase sigma-70 factor (ECF subfamily)